MSNWNLGKVEEMSSNDFVKVEPGYQEITVTGVEDIVAGTGSKGLKITLKSNKGGEFDQRYYLLNADGTQSKNAPAFRYFYENFSNSELPESFSTESITAALMGKTVDATVGGRKYTTAKEVEEVINGEVTKVIKKYNNIAAELPFGSWRGERAIKFSGQWESELAPSGDSLQPVKDDLPF